ncbi:MAG: hypothetical protein ACOY3Y_07200 [Acidobacteriota bacterium]
MRGRWGQRGLALSAGHRGRRLGCVLAVEADLAAPAARRGPARPPGVAAGGRAREGAGGSSEGLRQVGRAPDVGAAAAGCRAQLIRRVLDIDALSCPRCALPMVGLAFVIDPPVPPPVLPARSSWEDLPLDDRAGWLAEEQRTLPDLEVPLDDPPE